MQEELLKSGKLGDYSYQISLSEYGEISYQVTEPVGSVVDSGCAKSPEVAMRRVRQAAGVCFGKVL